MNCPILSRGMLSSNGPFRNALSTVSREMTAGAKGIEAVVQSRLHAPPQTDQQDKNRAREMMTRIAEQALDEANKNQEPEKEDVCDKTAKTESPLPNEEGRAQAIAKVCGNRSRPFSVFSRGFSSFCGPGRYRSPAQFAFEGAMNKELNLKRLQGGATGLHGTTVGKGGRFPYKVGDVVRVRRGGKFYFTLNGGEAEAYAKGENTSCARSWCTSEPNGGTAAVVEFKYIQGNGGVSMTGGSHAYLEEDALIRITNIRFM